jgi:DinB superfamily
MNTRDLTGMLATLLGELVDGPPAAEAYVLNREDAGLLRSLDRLTAADASAAVQGGASIAAHVDHLRYGLSLMNRWSEGENPFDTADWSASWRRTSVSDPEWQELRTGLAKESHRWLDAVRTAREVSVTELNGIVGSIVHFAYHLGAIRQINRAARGPAERSQP